MVPLAPIKPLCSPFGGIPRNWKLDVDLSALVEEPKDRSPFGGIPRNWKLHSVTGVESLYLVPPSGGSLEIGNSTAVEPVVTSSNRVFPLRGDP